MNKILFIKILAFLILICFSISFTFCDRDIRKNSNENIYPYDSLINIVITELLHQDSYPEIMKNVDSAYVIYTLPSIDSESEKQEKVYYKTKKTFFCKTIFPFIKDPDKVFKTPPPPGSYGEINLQEFYHSEKNNDSSRNKIFSPDDTLFFIEQINLFKPHIIDDSIFKDVNICSYDSLLIKRSSFFKVNLPLFSRDFNKVYIEFEYIGKGGGGHAYILRKIKNKWIILKSWSRWIS